MAQPWYQIDGIDKIDSPSLLIYKDRVQHNIALAIEMVGDASRLRPHVKTHKSPQATALMMQAGISKFKCATIAEAEMLAQCEAPDVLLAYQPTGPKIERLLKLMQQYPSTHFSCLVDSIDAAKSIADKVVQYQMSIDVFLDVNIGMNRTGALPENAVKIYEACSALAAIRLVGLHGYDGHINDTDLALRQQGADEAFNRLGEVREALSSLGLTSPVMVVGGSPTFGIHAERKGVECSPGTFVYWDRSYQQLFPELGFLPSALVLTRVVSVLDEKRICLDLGHKSIAAENALDRRLFFLNGDLKPIGHSEEHLVVETSVPHDYKPGDVFYGMPFHVCPTCALYEEAQVIEDGEVKEVWKLVARDRKISV